MPPSEGGDAGSIPAESTRCACYYTEHMDYQKNGYGKRPLWQWVLIYLIIGGIAYAAVYYFLFAGTGGYSYTNSNAPISSSTAPAEANPW